MTNALGHLTAAVSWWDTRLPRSVVHEQEKTWPQVNEYDRAPALYEVEEQHWEREADAMYGHADDW